MKQNDLFMAEGVSDERGSVPYTLLQSRDKS